MDVKKREMDLLSNSLAAYAHIKGKSQHNRPVTVVSVQKDGVATFSFIQRSESESALLAMRVYTHTEFDSVYT